jgi:hypothetical protein
MRTSMYKRKRPEVLYVDEYASGKKIEIALIKNGSNHTTNIGKDKVVIYNTCSFDSILQCFAAAYSDSVQFKTYLDSLPVREISFIDMIHYLLSNGSNAQLLRMRAQLLMKIIPYERSLYATKAISMNCAANVAVFFEKYFSDLYSCSKIETCEKCLIETSEKIPFTPHDYRVIREFGITDLQAAIDSSFDKFGFDSICSQKTDRNFSCRGNCNISVVPNSLQMVNVFYMDNCPTDKQFNLYDIPNTIAVKEENFILRGVVSFRPGSPTLETRSRTNDRNKNNITQEPSLAAQARIVGHYVTFSKRIDSSWELFDDLKDKVIKVSSNNKVIPHILLYTK